MANGKYPWIVAALIAVYAAWVAISGYLAHTTNFSWSLHDQKVARVQSREDITALIVGGSNAVYSLSAKELSSLSGQRWFNASLPSEGFTFENQERFLGDVTQAIDPAAVTTIVLSSVRHVISGLDDRVALHGFGYDGKKAPPLWLPYSSLATAIVDGVDPTIPTVVTPDGDLLYYAIDACSKRHSSGVISWASNDDIDYFLGTWLPVLHRDFPRAAIVVTIPSQYLDETVDASGLEAYVVRLNHRIAAWKVANPAAANLAVSVVAEPNTADPSFVCNQGHHFNNKGRTFRTNALWEALTEAPIVHN